MNLVLEPYCCNGLNQCSVLHLLTLSTTVSLSGHVGKSKGRETFMVLILQPCSPQTISCTWVIWPVFPWIYSTSSQSFMFDTCYVKNYQNHLFLSFFFFLTAPFWLHLIVPGFCISIHWTVKSPSLSILLVPAVCMPLLYPPNEWITTTEQLWDCSYGSYSIHLLYFCEPFPFF